MYRPIATLCILLVPTWGLPTWGQEDPSAVELVDRGIGLYLEGRYHQARQNLEKALNQEQIEHNRRMGALAYLAFCLVALGKEEEAQEVFSRIISLESDYHLPAGTSPKIVSVFEAVQAKTAPKVEPVAEITPEPSRIPAGAIPSAGNAPEREQPQQTASGKWWVWVLVGGVLAGAGVALALSLTGDQKPTGKALVTIRVFDP